MSKGLAAKLASLYALVFVIAPSIVLAQGSSILPTIVPQSCNQPGGCSSVCDIANIAQNMLNLGIYLAVFLSAVLFAWAGFLYLTNIANSGQHSRAVKIFTNVAIGLVIILGGWLVIDTLMKTLVGGSMGPWNKVCQLLLMGAGLA